MGHRLRIERHGFLFPRLRIAVAGAILAATMASCAAPVSSPTATPPDTSRATPIAADTLAPTGTPGPSDTPGPTDVPGPPASPLPTVAGKVLAWVSLQTPAKLVTGAGSTFQNAFFGWSHGYLAFHENLVTGSSVPWTSADGRAWQAGPALSMAGLSNGASVDEVVEGPAGLLAVGRAPGCADDGTGCMPAPANALWTSTDGLQWSRVDLKTAFGGGAVGDVAGGPKGYIAVSVSSVGPAAPAEWLSADGRIWRSVSLSSATFQDANLAEAMVLGDGYLVAGRTGSLQGWGGGFFPSTTPAIWWSADGSTWSRATLPKVASAPQAEAAISVVGSGKLVAHVDSWDCSCPPEGVTQAWTSSNGRAWKAVTVTFPSPAVVLTDGRQAIQLISADGAVTVAVSPDGFRWAQIAASGSGPADYDGEANGPAGLLVEASDGGFWLATIG